MPADWTCPLFGDEQAGLDKCPLNGTLSNIKSLLWYKMSKIGKLTKALPVAVSATIEQIGANLRLARVRRNLTQDDVAKRVGVGRKIIIDAEAGKATTSIAVYMAMAWVYGLLDQANSIADPTNDNEGIALELARGRERVRPRQGDLDNDF